MRRSIHFCARFLVAFCLVSSDTHCVNVSKSTQHVKERNSVGGDGRGDLERFRNPRDDRPRGASAKSTERSDVFINKRVLSIMHRLLAPR